MSVEVRPLQIVPSAGGGEVPLVVALEIPLTGLLGSLNLGRSLS